LPAPAAPSTLPAAMFGVLARLLRRLAAAYFGLRGRLAYRLGRGARARQHFERVLSLGGDEFSAYVHLGRIALGEGDFAGYRREMGNARACDPERFARLRPAADGLEPRAAGTPFEEAGERATWRSVRPGNQGIPRRTPVRSAEVPTETGDEALPKSPLFELPQTDLGQYRRSAARRADHDDFCTNQERERFRRMPPIRGHDVQGADIDELARRFGS